MAPPSRLTPDSLNCTRGGGATGLLPALPTLDIGGCHTAGCEPTLAELLTHPGEQGPHLRSILLGTPGEEDGPGSSSQSLLEQS